MLLTVVVSLFISIFYLSYCYDNNVVPITNINSICDLPLSVGDCKFNITRYYYDKNTNNCYKFIYKGCKGNGNRFVSEKQCKQRCKTKNGKKYYSNVLSNFVDPNNNLTCENCYKINGICIDNKCQCRMGYQLVNFKCVDVNECLWTECGSNAVCVNSLGSYRCECQLGYAGSGLNCTRNRYVCGQMFDKRYEESCNNIDPLWQQRYFYNYTGGFCQQFRYGGCQFESSQNIFRDLQACQSHCQGFKKGKFNEDIINNDLMTSTILNEINLQELCYDKFDESRRYPCTKGIWKSRYYFDSKSLKCVMFWYDESCDKKSHQYKSRNIFVHLRTCEQVCERIIGQQLESKTQGIAGVIQAVVNKDWNYAKILYDRLIASSTTTTTQIPYNIDEDNNINLFPDEEYLATPIPLPSEIPSITGNEVKINDESSNFIDHQYINESERERMLIEKEKTGQKLDLKTNYSLTARLPLTISEDCLDSFDSILTKSCEMVANWKERYFYDENLRSCRMYWYGGCWSHTKNNFDDLKTCKWKCEGKHNKPESRDCLEKFDDIYTKDCRNGMFEIRYYFNHNTKKCHSFYYGGCQSNSKNFFVDLGECQSTCEAVPKDILNFCSHPFDPIYRQACASDGSWSQYYYFDKITDSCRMFWYGNCKSESQNIFATLETCQWLCERKRENKVPSHCLDKFSDDYRKACNGGKWQERYYFDHTTGQCTSFWYDGCISTSQNIFNNYELCKSLCEVPSLTTETPIQNISKKELDEDSIRCLEPLAVGKCKEQLPAYYYNSFTKRCEPFSYSGCHGNGNKFLTLSQCETTCKKYYHLEEVEAHCFLPLSIGFGRRKKSCIRYAGYYYYYNSNEGKCGRFWYLGCGGNANKYKTLIECEQICRGTKEKAIVLNNKLSVSSCFESIDSGKCEHTKEQLILKRWGYSPSSGKCIEFNYSGCKGNNNNFATERQCTKLCKKLKQPRSMQCAHHPDWGPCNRLRYMWFYNLTNGVCEQFLYGGCGGNDNRFSTFELCQITCEVPGEDPCSDKLDRGKWCESMSNRYYYHPKTKTCKGFHYTGCGQSRNNFLTVDECESVCIHRTRTYSESMTKSNSADEINANYSNTGASVKYIGQKPTEKPPMQMHTILSEKSSHYFKTEGQWVEYGHCLGFRYNISGEYTKLKSYICLMEEGGTCQVETLGNTNGEELCKVIRPWLRGSHYYSWFFTIERKKIPFRILAEERRSNKNETNKLKRPQRAADTVASLMVLPLNDCYNIC